MKTQRLSIYVGGLLGMGLCIGNMDGVIYAQETTVETTTIAPVTSTAPNVSVPTPAAPTPTSERNSSFKKQKTMPFNYTRGKMIKKNSLKVRVKPNRSKNILKGGKKLLKEVFKWK